MDKQFRHATEIQVRFRDIDQMGHVNNAVYATYLEYARVKYADDILGVNIDWSENGLILARTVIDYKAPVLFKDKVIVKTRCTRIGNKSFELEYVVEKGEGITAATGSTVLVGYDYKAGKTTPISDEWKNKLIEYEGIDNIEA